MKELMSEVFAYHSRNYELVKLSSVMSAVWHVYTYDVNGRGSKLFEISDVKYSAEQALHTVKHCLLNYDSGLLAGRRQIKKELKNLVDTALD